MKLLGRVGALAVVASAFCVLAGVGWSAGGAQPIRVVASATRPAGMYVTATGVLGVRGERVVRLKRTATGASSLSLDGRFLVYEVHTSVRVHGGIAGSASLRVRDLQTGADTLAVMGGHDPTFRRDGSLVYFRADFREGVGQMRFQPMEQSRLGAAAVAIGVPLRTGGALFPAASGRALAEVPTSAGRTGVIVLQPGREPRVLLRGVGRSGVVSISRGGGDALLWYSHSGSLRLALVRVRDGRVLSRVDTQIRDQRPASPQVATGAWAGSRVVVAFGGQIVLARVRGGALQLLDRLALPIVESRHGGGRIAVKPDWLKFRTATGRKFIFAADLAGTNLAGVRDTALFTCDAGQARCRRSTVPGGSGLYTTGVGVEPVTHAGSGVISP